MYSIAPHLTKTKPIGATLVWQRLLPFRRLNLPRVNRCGFPNFKTVPRRRAAALPLLRLAGNSVHCVAVNSLFVLRAYHRVAHAVIVNYRTTNSQLTSPESGRTLQRWQMNANASSCSCSRRRRNRWQHAGKVKNQQYLLPACMVIGSFG